MKYSLTIILSLGMLALAAGWTEVSVVSVPGHFPEPVYSLANADMSPAQIELGRALFYDPVLSRDSMVSCASCHSSYNAFAHTDHKLSHGIDDQIGTRNAPALFNLAWQTHFMWDGAINHLDMQALAPISHPGEMDETLAHVVAKLQNQPRYVAAFKQAFGDEFIEGVEVLKALSQFQATLISADARYDKVQRGVAAFSEQESKGEALFTQHCASCHAPPLFTTGEFAHNGMALDSILNDYGRGAITLQAADSLQFKIPSLRNLGFTAPYGHDGRFSSLRKAIHHYTQIDTTDPDIDPRLKRMPELTSRNVTDLISFLRTLNDTAFVFHPDHQFPRSFFFSKAPVSQTR